MAYIIVVDDDALVRESLRLLLERAGHAVAEAPDGNVALQLLGQKTADIMIIDIIMPEKEGIETILDIRRHYPGVRTIAISGGGRTGPQQYLEAARGMGARYTFEKPVDGPALLKAIDELLLQNPLPRGQ